MTGRWKGGKSKTTLSPPSHRPLEISLNMVRFPHSHSTAAGNPLFSSITGRVTLNRAKSVNHVPGLKCPLCPRLHRSGRGSERRRRGTQPIVHSPCVIRKAERITNLSRDTALGGAESKGPDAACWQMILGAFRPQTTTEDRKVTNSDRSVPARGNSGS